MNSLNPRDYFTGVYKPKADSEFDDEYELKVPKENEIKILANRNRECCYINRL
jgi:hypothetical protein